jgi:tRNA nucleotidyltransferase (CCA-adding enzyme)
LLPLAAGFKGFSQQQPKVQVFKTYGTAMLRFEDTDIEFVGARKNPTILIVGTPL